jgi:hypothetical protein
VPQDLPDDLRRTPPHARPRPLHQVAVLAQAAAEAAILRAVLDAEPLPGLPAARDLPR